MKLKFLRVGEPLPTSGEVFAYNVLLGSAYDALDAGLADLVVVTGRQPGDDVAQAIADALLADGEIDQDDYDFMMAPDGPENSYYVEFSGPWPLSGGGSKSASRPASVPLTDLQTINDYRARQGRGPIDLSAGWTDQELKDMADNIRTRGTEYNPRRESIKRKLMR